MNEETFLECLSKKKLFDVEDRPLRLHKHIEDTRKDTFFRCISTGLLGLDDARNRIQIRAACLMRFITLMFLLPSECSSVAIFLNDYAEDAVVKGMAYKDKAIQVWFLTHTPYGHTEIDVVFKRKKQQLKEYAIEFVKQNNQIGHLSCRFTFGYLLTGLYGINLHLYDQFEEHGDVHTQPVIYRRARRGEKPQDSDDDETEQKQVHIYIWKTHNSFKLLVPIVERALTRTQFWIKERMSQHTKHKYQLRKSEENKMRNVRVCNFERLRDTKLHVCDVRKADVSESCIYMVYPAGGDFKLYMEPQEHLFVFCVRESKQDIGPYLEVLLELKHNITYPYFMLKKDVKRIAVLVIDTYRDEAIELAKKELNVD